jgi:2',3'-cyclic-nucleotide 2'-phosphodiesterase (5'-nucleotidase family)
MKIRSSLLIIAAVAIATILGIDINAQTPAKTVRIIYTNDTMGYLEPCGCGGRRLGGLPKRVMLLQQLTKGNPNAVIVDSGNLSDRAEKLDLLMSVLKQLRYDAVGMGQGDWRISKQFFEAAKKHGITIVEAHPNARDYALESVIKDVGGVKVGIVSFGAVPPDNELSDLEISKVRFNAYKAARNKCDLLILLDQGNVVNEEWLNNHSQKLGVPDFVIGGQTRYGMSEVVTIGKTRIVPTGLQAKTVGCIDVTIRPNAEWEVNYRKILLDENVTEDEATAKLVKETQAKIDEEDRRRVITVVTDSSTINPPAGRQSSYYPPLLCKTCHVKQYEDWATTDHAHALKSLPGEKKTAPECIRCHSEAFRRINRIEIPRDEPGGIECATCHYDALPHDMSRKDVKERTKVDRGICLECHDATNSPNFDMRTYMPKVNHSRIAAPH